MLNVNIFLYKHRHMCIFTCIINIFVFMIPIDNIIINIRISEVVASCEGTLGYGLKEDHIVRCKFLSKVWFL